MESRMALARRGASAGSERAAFIAVNTTSRSRTVAEARVATEPNSASGASKSSMPNDRHMGRARREVDTTEGSRHQVLLRHSAEQA